MQIGIDAVDLPSVREFWRVVLGYAQDPRDMTGLVDPRRLNTVVFFQPMDASDTARRGQRNRDASSDVDPGRPRGQRGDITYSVGRAELFGP